MKAWTYTETSVFDYEVTTTVKLFKNETDIRQYFNKQKEEELRVIDSWNKEVFNDLAECGDGDIYLHTNTDDNFGYYEYGYAYDCEFFMRIEEKEVE